MYNELLLQMLKTGAKIDGPVRRKVFISHSHLHQPESEEFIERFGGPNGVFIAKALGVSDRDDFIKSTDTQYVMQRIRDLYIQDSTVTIVLVGSCTHSRRYVDWEIKASLQQGQDSLPNGLMAIQLKSSAQGAILPHRLEMNWNSAHQDCYARYWRYPQHDEELRGLIEDAYQSRQARAKLIQNPQEIMKNNVSCGIHKITH